MASFANIADTDFSTVERPKPLPVGEYVVAVRAVPTHTERDDGAIIIEFPLRVVSATDDVDLSDYDGNVVGKFLRHSIWIRPGDKDDGGMFKLKKFLEETLGVEIPAGKGGLPKALNDTIGREFMATVVWTQKDDDTFTNVKSVRARND
jgi:hypothetical protein